jgi:heat shock protein HtpX
MKRIALFLITNLLVVLTLTIVCGFLGIGRYGGPYGMNLQSLALYAFVWGMGGAFISLQMSRWIAKQSVGVQLVDGRTGSADADWLYQTIARLTQQAGLPMPEVGIYDSPELNAFATGPSASRSLVAVSSGILRGMRPEELEGVLAHEVSHIRNGDMVTMTLLQGVLNAFVIFFSRVVAYLIASRGDRENRGGSGMEFLITIVLQVVLGILASLVTAWFSRQREFRADRGGATLAGRPQMIAALRRLQANQELVDPNQPALATLKINGGTARMLFATHPPLEVRIAALERNA